MRENKIKENEKKEINEEELTTTLGSVDLSSVKNMEDPKVVERVND